MTANVKDTAPVCRRGSKKCVKRQTEHELFVHEHMLPCGHGITLSSDLGRAWGGTCGSTLWAAGPALLTWISDHSELQKLFEGRNVLELGAGLGFTGMALVLAGASHCILTDLPEQQGLLELNASANPIISDRVTCQTLIWGEAIPTEILCGNWEVIVATDVIYDSSALAPLAHTLSSLLNSKHNAGALLALPDRTDFAHEEARIGQAEADEESGMEGWHPLRPDFECFFDEAARTQCGLRWTLVGRISAEDAGCSSNIFVFHMQGTLTPQPPT